MFPIGAERRRGKPPLVTWSIIAINVIVYILSLILGYENIVKNYGMIPAFVVEGKRLYTLITSMFLHGGLLHLGGNMLYLYIFGPGIETRLGKARYLALYLASGIVASFFHIFIVYNFSEPIIVYGPFGYSIIDPRLIPCVGASGAISGILGAYMLLMPNKMIYVLTYLWPGLPYIIRAPAYLFIGFWFAYQLLMGLLSLAVPAPYFSGVAFWAHIGGFIAGVFLASSLSRKMKKRRRIVIDYTGRKWYEIPVE